MRVDTRESSRTVIMNFDTSACDAVTFRANNDSGAAAFNDMNFAKMIKRRFYGVIVHRFNSDRVKVQSRLLRRLKSVRERTGVWL